MTKSGKDKKIESLEKELEQAVQHISELEEDNVKKTTTIDDYLNTMKLIQADFENYKKRAERERVKTISYAKEDLIVKLLELKDNFERAFSVSDKDSASENVYKGFEMIYEQLCKVLSDEDVSEIECVNKIFDPYYHEALMMEDGGEGDIDVVCKEFQKGYKLKDKVIRHSKVSVRKVNDVEGE
ncbi:MAG TPA: nucleotide exchange factor GrpE [Candidatus Methanofastidiosa archaeon]|nr:nucleotide exchange factor GrpE [Candidatus Methanofastidiosa archaeon]HPR42585.1 nucleotide exchange factor GrpE [Candidatus Methanofastidiosa archaeon]